MSSYSGNAVPMVIPKMGLQNILHKSCQTAKSKNSSSCGSTEAVVLEVMIKRWMVNRKTGVIKVLNEIDNYNNKNKEIIMTESFPVYLFITKQLYSLWFKICENKCYAAM